VTPPLVVVGVDGSPEAEGALAFAIEEARLRGARLRIVSAWEPSSAAYAGEAFAATPDIFVEAEQHAEDLVRSAAEHAIAAGVTAEAVVEEGGPAGVLIEQSEDAALLVVGSRGLGATKRLLLGSVSTSLSHHVRCPLAIVPHGETRTPA
jgi:nucleotide-binding universal stress UspA family protein